VAKLFNYISYDVFQIDSDVKSNIFLVQNSAKRSNTGFVSRHYKWADSNNEGKKNCPKALFN